MRISTRFAVIGAACAIVSVAIAAAMIAAGRRVADEVRKNRVAADIVESVAGLRYLTIEYALRPEQRVEMQWTGAHGALGNVLRQSSGFDSKEERASFALIREAYEHTTTTFAELVRAERARQAGEGNREVMDELLRRLTAAVVSRTLVMMRESFRLQDASREAVAAAQRSVLATVIVLSSALVIVVAGSMFFAFRGIARPLARLREGTQRVGAGDLEHTIGLAGGDEVADVAREFDKMSARLRTTTVSRDRLAESEERTRLILETALDAVISIDSEGLITAWNPQAEAVFGWPSEEIMGRSLADTIIPPQHRDAHRAGLRRYLATGEGAVLNRRVELSALRRDGSEFPIELSITPIRTGSDVTFSAFLRDITARRHAESRVQAQLERLSLLDQITHAIGERQDLQSIYQVAIRSLEERLPVDFSCVCRFDALEEQLTVVRVGLHSAPLAMELAMPESAIVPIDENGLSRCVHGHLVYEPDTQLLAFPFPQRLLRAGLRSVVAAPLQSESQVFGILIAARTRPNAFDSGECEFLHQLSSHVALAARQAELHASLQRAYDDLRQTQQSVMQQERLRALGEMASGIAHDINNAISPVTLYTESLLEREAHLSERGRDQLRTIAMAIDDVAATVARMREFYRQREPQAELQAVQLNELVRHVVELTRARWQDMPQQRGAVVKLNVDLAAGLPTVLGAQTELREALINLVFNAIDAMPGGGTLSLRTRAPASPEQPVLLEVADSGIGMDEATRRRCLEPFFTTKGDRGTGLGLAMVYGAVQRHGADIDIDSRVGQGTTVSIAFPSTPGRLPLPVGTASPMAPLAPLRILLVDDDPVILKTLSETLSHDGHEVDVASGGQAGIDRLRAARAGDRGFDVVVTDLGMPYVDGRRVAAAVKETDPATTVIMLTGWGLRLVADSDIPPHVDRMLAKPPKLQALRAALAEVVPRSADARGIGGDRQGREQP